MPSTKTDITLKKRFLKNLGRILLILLGLTGVLLLLLYANKLLQYDLQAKGIELPRDGSEQIKLINEYRKTVLQLIGGIVVAVGLYLTWRRIRAMEKNVFVADLEEANLGTANLDGAYLAYADLDKANLRYANLRRANLEMADFRGANLEMADLRGAYFRKTDFKGANMRQAMVSSRDWLQKLTDEDIINIKAVKDQYYVDETPHKDTFGDIHYLIKEK